MPSKILVSMCLVLIGFWLPCDSRAQDLDGQWYGVGWDAANEFVTDYLSMTFDVVGGAGTATVYVPAVGAFHQTLPVTVVGDAITIGNPAVFGLTGTITGETIEGEGWQAGIVIGTWFVEKSIGAPTNPGPAPGPTCDQLPSLLCTGSVEHCFELIQFEPDEGPGYWDYPIPGETSVDQWYSFLRRDAVMLIKYAAAKVECKTEFWDYGNFEPLGLGDMSEEDGSTPGANIGSLRHPPGTHEDGNDLDVTSGVGEEILDSFGEKLLVPRRYDYRDLGHN